MMPRNNKIPHIVFLFSDTGGGHRSAAQAIIEALEIYYPNQVTTEMVDFFVEYAPPPFDLAPATYAQMGQVPELWKLGYKLSDGKRRSKFIQEVLWPYIRKSTANLVQEHPCDLFLSVHPIVNTPILRTLEENPIPYMIVITDMVTTHAFWYSKRANLTLTPTEEARDRGLEFGLNPGKIKVVGQPIADQYRRPTATKSELRKKFGWPEDLPVVLMVSGGEGMGPVEEMIRAVDGAGLDLMMVVIAGRNQSLKLNLEEADLQTPNEVLGFVENMPDLMNAADIIVTKAGPGTISEAFIAGLPIILYSRMPGQEDGNIDYVVDKGSGVWAPRPMDVVETLQHWLEDPSERQRVAAVSKSLARPDASMDIAGEIIKIVNNPQI
jgi:1,2-diacylglycerol 3-beta-galactosyltransferase